MDIIKMKKVLSNDGLYAILSSIADGVISTDRAGIITFINEAAQRLTGWSEFEAVNKSANCIFKLTNAKTNGQVNNPLETAINENCRVGLVNYTALVTKAGDKTLISANATPVYNENNQLAGAVVVFRDISRYKKIEEELIAEKDKLKANFQNVPVGLVIVNDKSEIQEVNNAFVSIFETDNSKLIGKRFGEGICCINSFESGCGQGETCGSCSLRNTIMSIFHREETLTDLKSDYVMMRDGKKLSRCFKINFTPINTDGKNNIMLALTDITEQKKAEEVLKKYQLLSENASDIILFTDSEGGKIVEANAAALKAYGYTRDEMLSKTIYELRGFDPHTNVHMQKVKETSLFFEAVHHRRDGTAFNVEVNAQSAVVAGKTCVISIIRDITERKKAEEQIQAAMETAKAANRAKSEFLANMSHEIRTPLNGILGMLDLTLLTELDGEQRDNVETAKDSADLLLGIINDILDFSKIEAGRLMIESVEFSLPKLAEKVVKLHGYRAKEKGLELSCQISESLPEGLLGDPNRLQQILNNLLSNAVKFTERGAVKLIIESLGSTDNGIELGFSVMDTGIGIASGEMNKLFKSFSQVDSSHTRKYGGTGLGLVISKQLVEMMGGTLGVESEKGKGSTFRFVMRFSKVDSHYDKLEESLPGLEEDAPQKTNILVVEDDAVNQTVIRYMLDKMGYNAEIAKSGIDALEILKEKDFGLCMMDIQMSEMDGIQTTAILREQEKHTGKHLPIIALTAHALQGDRERFISAGMDEYIAKPFKIVELSDTIHRTLAKCRKPEMAYFKDVLSKWRHSETELSDAIEAADDRLLQIKCHIQQLTLSIINNDTYMLESVAYQVKELAAEIDAEELRALAFRIQLAARRGNMLQSAELAGRLSEACELRMKNIKKKEGE